MQTRVTCPRCQKADLYEKIAGLTQIECSGCKAKLTIRGANPVKPLPVNQLPKRNQREIAPSQAILISDSQEKFECSCPGCRVKLRIPISSIGKIAKCPRCQTRWNIERHGSDQTEAYSSPVAKSESLLQTQTNTARQADWWSEIEQAPLATVKAQESWKTGNQADFSRTSAASNSGSVRSGFWGSIIAWMKHRRTKFRWKEPMNFRIRLRVKIPYA